ncbi:MAG TPA: hypothetical protein VF692_08010 [Pyrinomonadaceae bacterium]|jgi:hypothetical protein
MKLTLKLFLVLALAATTIFADGDMNNGGFNPDGDMNNGGRTCTVNCPTPSAQNPEEADTQTIDENDDADSVLTIIEDYLTSLFG